MKKDEAPINPKEWGPIVRRHIPGAEMVKGRMKPKKETAAAKYDHAAEERELG